MASNIPLGTYVSDGVRTGPLYTGQLPQGFVSDANGVITSSSHDNFGPAVLLSSQSTWNITPAEAPGAGFTKLDNLVGLTGVGAITSARDLILRGDNKVTFLNNGVVQFDWPRIVTVTVSNAVAPNNARVTIFGTDLYGFPMQHTYVLLVANGVPHTYPVINIGAHTVDLATKAFYTVTRVYIDSPLNANNSQISLGCADAFGLPYRTDNFGDVTSIGWDSGSELSSLVAGNAITPLGIYVPAATVTSTAITGDVRGFYVPSTDANNTRNLRFTYYVRGADTWINQTANRQQLYMQQTGSVTPQGVAVPPLNVNDLYGVPQFYTGSPS